MASHRHINCKLPPKDSKNRIPLAEHCHPKNKHSKNKLVCQNLVENNEKKTFPASKLPVPIRGKIPRDGTLNFKGNIIALASNIASYQ